MTDSHTLCFHPRTQTLERDAQGHNTWVMHLNQVVVPAPQTALLLCDVWDVHWSAGANDRLSVMLPRMNAVVAATRAAGVQIIHAPSDTMAFYAGAPARERVVALPRVEPPAPIEHADPTLPVDATDGGSDTNEPKWFRAWSRQHPAIEVDQARDAISDNGAEVYSLLRHKDIQHLLIMGVHTNMCILNRSFAIKQMVRWGVDVMLIRDLTDTMYNPAKPPYVSHAEGTRLVIEFIEKFWCPTIASTDLVP